ncbi:hypothetical protein B0H10DRAFT_2229990 [Mycena sp. CBHHK59/15]|nr:hypothetical protein B0H10DRAFT_2229990 [Mycena sp. CBHHK59/15]
MPVAVLATELESAPRRRRSEAWPISGVSTGLESAEDVKTEEDRARLLASQSEDYAGPQSAVEYRGDDWGHRFGRSVCAWAELNPPGGSVVQMGTGPRVELLDEADDPLLRLKCIVDRWGLKSARTAAAHDAAGKNFSGAWEEDRHSQAGVRVAVSPTKAPQAVRTHLRPDEPWVGGTSDEYWGAPPEEPNYNGPEAQADDESDSGGSDEEEESGCAKRDLDFPLRQWVEKHCDLFLNEMLRLEGRGDHRACTLPLHRIQFEKKTLKQLGLWIQLGHWQGRDRRCPLPEMAPGDKFVLIGDNAPASADVSRDDKPAMHSGYLQRAAAVSAHVIRIEVLGVQIYHSLGRETDNMGLKLPKADGKGVADLQMIKRAGRGHDPKGAKATEAGECVLLCPVCPHPGKNLPPDWENVRTI